MNTMHGLKFKNKSKNSNETITGKKDKKKVKRK